MLPLALLSHSACTPATALADCTGSACVNGTCACDAGWSGARCAAAALGPATRAFTMPHTWLWGAAPARSSSNDRYYAFAMALKNRCGIYHYRHNAYIVRGTATSPLGPFEYDGVALDNRTAPHFDAVEVEDPNLVALPGGAGYLLFYAGSAFPSPLPPGNHTAHLNCTATDVPDSDSQMLAEGNRIGVAFAPSLDAPFTALPDPVLRTRPGHWDSTRVSNPAALVFANGTTLLLYRGNGADPRHGNGIGVARAPHWSGPYETLLETPLFDGYAEDPTLFVGPTGVLHMLAHGELRSAGATGVGIHSVSTDGVNWTPPVTAYTTDVVWAGQENVSLGRRETPELLLGDDGQPAFLFNSAAPCGCYYGKHDPRCNWGDDCRSFSMAAPFLRT